jgi:small-conductance mechanosensitive channel
VRGGDRSGSKNRQDAVRRGGNCCGQVAGWTPMTSASCRSTKISHPIGLFLAALIVWAAVGPAFAQVPPTGVRKPDTQKSNIKVPERLTAKQVDSLLARLSDKEVRQLLQQYLVERARRQTAEPAFYTTLRKQLEAVTRRVPRMLGEVPPLPADAARGLARLRQVERPMSPWAFLFWLVLAGALGIAVWYTVTKPLKARVLTGDRAGRTWLRLLFEGAGVAGFAIVTGILLAIGAGANPLAGSLYLAVFWAAVLALIGVGLSRVWLGPGATLHARFGGKAVSVHHHFAIVALIAAFAGMVPIFLVRLGISELAASAILFIGGWVAGLVLISAFWRLQHLFWLAEADAATGTEETDRAQDSAGPQNAEPPNRTTAQTESELSGFWRRNWATFYAVYVLLVLVIWSFRVLSGTGFVAGGIIYSLLLLIAGIVIDRLVVRILTGRNKNADHAIQLRRLAPASAALVFGVRLALIVGGALIFLRIWGMDLIADANNAIGPSVTRAIIDIALIIYVAFVLYITLRGWIDRRLAEEKVSDQPAEEAGEGAGAPRSRIATLLPLARGVIGVTVVTMAILIVLSRLGVNIGPLLAGAGVIGLAIGFGSQALVRDVVSGAFFLIDDAFRVGEYVESGSVKGTVEQIGIRSMRLRHHRGMIHTVPYGELKSVTNYSRDWVIMKLEFRLPFGTDMERVRKLIKRTGQEMAEIPEFAEKMLEPLKSQGVVRTEGAALIFRAKFTAKPGGQFLIRREAFRRIQEALMAEGIAFAPDSVAVRVLDDSEVHDREVAIEAAAGAAAARKKAQDQQSEGVT